MAKVPITVMGYRCEREQCGHEWIPRESENGEPRVCPKCKSAWWNRPKGQKGAMMSYEDFSSRIAKTISDAGGSLTWTEIRTIARLPQKFPNNQWVRKMEQDVGLIRKRDSHGIIHWEVGYTDADATTKQTQSSEHPGKATGGE